MNEGIEKVKCCKINNFSNLGVQVFLAHEFKQRRKL